MFAISIILSLILTYYIGALMSTEKELLEVVAKLADLTTALEAKPSTSGVLSQDTLDQIVDDLAFTASRLEAELEKK